MVILAQFDLEERIVARMPKRMLLLALVCWLGFVACGGPKTTDAPVSEGGQPVLVDIGEKFQITQPYFEMAFSRVPPANRYQYLTPAGKRDFLEKLAIESVYYLEGVRRRLFKAPEFKKILDLRLYSALNEEVRRELLKNITVTDEQVKEFYDKTVKNPEQFPFADIKEKLRYQLLSKALDDAYAAKKAELMAQYQVKINYELIEKIKPGDKPENYPAATEALATGTDYTYTIGQLLKRIEEMPRDAKAKLKETKLAREMLDYVIGEDVVHHYAELQGLDKTAEFELRKKVVEVGTLSYVTRGEIVGHEIKATIAEAKAYYDKHVKDFVSDGETPSFEQAKDAALARASDEKQEQATRGLAQSLMAHRYPTVYFEPQIKQYLQ